jgi:hypothetical protein
MKTSNKIMLLLAVTLVGGLFLSNYKLKQQFDKIDTSDPYWNYPIRETGEFHHVQIVGGNLLRTKIIAGEKNQVMREENLKDWLTAEIKNDTLYVDFATHVPATREDESQPLSNFEVVIMMKELHSVTINKSTVELKVPTSDTLKIVAQNSSGVDLQKIGAGKSVSVLVENNSFFGIYKQDEERLELQNLSISARHKSTLILNNVVAKNGTIKMDGDTKITADGGLLKSLVVE